uniref:NADH dehydrogenase subunit 6 n=1 Tax=Conchocele cf. bisecta HPD1644 TaxID=1872713 RepID=A0A1B4WRK6_9BIVA|nr:NADH dehydrogenase subunit 6 [Conchocele cf. bisecta HPD1644]
MVEFFFILVSFYFILLWVAHPFSFGALLLISSIVVSGWVSFVSSSWYGFMLFLIFVGGLLVLFSYTCALVPLSKDLVIEMKLKMILFLLMTVMMIFILMKIFIPYFIIGGNEVMSYGSSTCSGSGVLITSFTWDVSIVWFVLLLFLVMILVAYVCKNHMFPLRFFLKK